MRLKVSLSSFNNGSGGAEVAQVFVECGSGEQVLRWVAYTACSRLAYLRGDSPLTYVPQSVCASDGTIMDVDIVLNEVCDEGDSLTVEFSHGPEAFKARWEGRPNTPPFQWGKEGEIGPTDNEWLNEMDLSALGLAALVNADLVAQNRAALEQDLAAVHAVLLQYAGGLQALFKFYDSQKEEDPKQLDRMTLDQFRSLLADARITTDHFKAAAIDECFHAFLADVQSRVELTITRKMPASSSTAAPTLGFQDFLLCLVWVANKKFQLALEGPTSGYAEVSQQLSHLITDHLFPNLGPALFERVKALDAAVTDNTTLLLKKGRRLTEQTLDSCQLRRVASAERAIDIKYLCVHLKKWEILHTRGVDLNGLMIILLFAKHRDPELIKMELKKQPMEVNYDEFERLLLAMAYKMYTAAGTRPEPFDEFLGETLDEIYKKSGVLVELHK